MNLVSVLQYHAYRNPESTALIFNDLKYSYKQLDELSNRYSNGLLIQGVKKGDKVCFFLKNSAEFVILAYAVWKAGAVLVPTNFRLTSKELRYIIEQSDSVLVFTESELIDVTVDAAKDLPLVQGIYSVGECSEEVPSLEELYTSDTSNPLVEITEEDYAQILYTSGTTGFPKGALFTHKNISSLNSSATVMLKLNRDDVFTLVAPAFHSAGLNMVTTSVMFAGGTLLIERDFHPVEAQKKMEQYKATIFFGVPAMYTAMLQVPKGAFNLSSVRLYIYGAAPMSPALIEAAIDYFDSDQFLNACGLTEGGPGGIYLSPEEHKTKLGAAGKAMPFTDVRVVNEKMEDVNIGEVGEFILRGRSIMKEYYKKPEETKKTLRDGWLLTGDLATIDEEGYITLVDRKKDMIISGGENVYSVEVEQVLNGYPSILEAAIIGLPDPKWGEVVSAVIVKRDGQEVDEEGIKAYCREHLAGYKIPRKFLYVDSLPRNASGKILKYNLREQFQSET